RDDPLVVLERPVRMVAADDVDLPNFLADHADDVLDRVLEGAGLALLASEAAERAGEDADVRRRDVAVEDEVDAVALARGLDVIGDAAQAEEIFGVEEEEAVVTGEAVLLLDFFPDGDQAFVGEMQVLTSTRWRRENYSQRPRRVSRFPCHAGAGLLETSHAPDDDRRQPPEAVVACEAPRAVGALEPLGRGPGRGQARRGAGGARRAGGGRHRHRERR